MNNKIEIKKFNKSDNLEIDLLILAAGFEKRTLGFFNIIQSSKIEVMNSIILRYENQKNDNDPNYFFIYDKIISITKNNPETINISGVSPIKSYSHLKYELEKIISNNNNRNVIIDISGMSNIFSIGITHICLLLGLKVSIIYTEANKYYPLKSEQEKMIRAWLKRDYDLASKYLQSAALKAVHILPDFSGIFKPGQKTSLIIFVGFEPNRIEGLIDDYAPGGIVVLYGRSPHEKFKWRTQLSETLHEDIFSKWPVRKLEVSTLLINEMLDVLESEYDVIHNKYDVAIAPQCSKMQAIASYLFWRKHPEVQLVFTSPVKFNPLRYSKGIGKTYLIHLNNE